MWCQNCGKERAHSHQMESYKAKYCQRCREKSTATYTYCRFCGENRRDRNDFCDVHGGNCSSSTLSDNGGSSDSPPAYSPPRYDFNDDDDYATDVSSPRSSSPVTTNARKKCASCQRWFKSNSDYDDHITENTSGCSRHEVCFPRSDIYQHAKDLYHERCFVPGCDSVYAKNPDNNDQEIMDHVWNIHTDRGMTVMGR